MLDMQSWYTKNKMSNSQFPAARLVHTNPELRLGVFTSLLGTPFFFWLVVRIRKVAP